MQPVKSWFGKLMSHDRRKARRHEVSALAAYYWDGGAPVAHRIRDISSAGFYLLTEQRWYVGTLVTMTLQWTGSADTGSERSIGVQAKVVRTCADGVGLAFVLADRQNGRQPQGHLQGAVDKKALERFLSPIVNDRIA